MCTVCGCSDGNTKVDGKAHDHHDEGHHHGPGHGHHHGPDGSLDYGQSPAGVYVPGLSQSRLIEIETDILSKNNTIAQENRRRLSAENIICINMMSSPGSGKTSLLVETIRALSDTVSMAVIEGDQQTDNDAKRIRETGIDAIQVNTGKGCHLDASMVATALDHMALPRGGILFIENVGNLVCPAGFDLGEARRVVLASVTEGEDKPIKYPEMFASADATLITKCDLTKYLDFDIDLLTDNVRKVQPRTDIIQTSVKGDPGLQNWTAWIYGLHQQLAIAAQ